MIKPPYWLDPTQWVCTRHVPTARIPESQERCWYNCGTTRPPHRPEPPVEAPPVVRVAPPPPPPPPVVKVKVTPPPPPPPEPVIEVVTVVEVPTPQLEPSPEEKRRGATHLVSCLTCGVPLWRRKKEIEAGLKPFCSPAHRAAFSKQ